jgi:hypothetical protein
MVTLIATRSGSPFVGLLYPTALLLMTLVVGYFFLPETRGTDLNS